MGRRWRRSKAAENPMGPHACRGEVLHVVGDGVPRAGVDAWLAPARWQAGSPAGLASTSAEGEPIRWSNLRRRVWLPAVAASVGGPCRFHDLRHSHAALLIAQGELPKAI
jgi:site-specific recombinase XerC